MKNLITSSLIILLSVSIFSCNNSNDPQPQTQTPTMAGFSAAPENSNAAMQVGPKTTTRPPANNKFEWQLVKTVTLPMNKGLNLKSPFAIVNEDAGDISWGSDGGCYYAIKSWKVTNANLKIVDVKSVLPANLKTLPFVKGMINWAPSGSYSWTNYMPIGTVIAYRDTLGKYVLVVVKSDSPLILDIYNEHNYIVY